MTFFELERECKKRRLIKAILFFSLLIVLLMLIMIVFSKFYFKANKNDTFVIKEVNKSENINSSKRVLKPIIDLNYEEVADNKVNKTTHKNISKIKKDESQKNRKIILSSKTLPSFDTCIKLAEEYYKSGDYENALKWAKNANLQNNRDPKSWIIVGKSLYKLGKKDKALKVLQVYYKYTKNKEVLDLINRIKSGKI
jgi:tetratricopeptide (TPR) repeat protein